MSASSLPSTQRGVVINQYGQLANVLTLKHDLPIPKPSASQVLVRVSHAAINPIDWKLAVGEFPWVPLTFPHIPGFDVSGTVVSVGSSVTRFNVGDRVYGDGFTRSGTFQQYSVVEEEELSMMPPNISMPEAAGIPLAAETSLTALNKAGVKGGSRVLIIAAAGGCGAYGVQIAKALGASQVVGLTSTKNVEFVLQLGADTVVDYTQTKLSASSVRDIDVVYDTVGGYWDEARHVMKPNGKFVTIAFWETPPKSQEQGTHEYFAHILTSSHTHLDTISEWVKQGKIKTNIDKIFPFTQAGVVALYEYSKAGKTRGKAVINIGGE